MMMKRTTKLTVLTGVAALLSVAFAATGPNVARRQRFTRYQSNEQADALTRRRLAGMSSSRRRLAKCPGIKISNEHTPCGKDTFDYKMYCGRCQLKINNISENAQDFGMGSDDEDSQGQGQPSSQSPSPTANVVPEKAPSPKRTCPGLRISAIEGVDQRCGKPALNGSKYCETCKQLKKEMNRIPPPPQITTPSPDPVVPCGICKRDGKTCYTCQRRKDQPGWKPPAPPAPTSSTRKPPPPPCRRCRKRKTYKEKHCKECYKFVKLRKASPPAPRNTRTDLNNTLTGRLIQKQFEGKCTFINGNGVDPNDEWEWLGRQSNTETNHDMRHKETNLRGIIHDVDGWNKSIYVYAADGSMYMVDRRSGAWYYRQNRNSNGQDDWTYDSIKNVWYQN